ncbi:MAG: DNA-3-methyladenine glycosylase I [Bdellovibrionales bacterium]|nr:DNA-3-methyladenine glycosylase I [Bdellovibrionales bacterium]
MKKRCTWPGNEDELMIAYHDKEWGAPVHDDRKHFEFLILEGAQAGLSWRTILHRRKGYKKAFSDFDPKKIVKYSKAQIKKLMGNPEIIRNRLKIESVITNAEAFLRVQKEFGSFDAYCWRFVGGKPIVNRRTATGQIPASTPESDAFSKDLKKRGFKFVGTTIVYAHMQATGMVNDHLTSCFRYRELKSKV